MDGGLWIMDYGCGYGYGRNQNIGGRCKCDECLMLDGWEYTLSNSITDMKDKCVDNGCLMTNDKVRMLMS